MFPRWNTCEWGITRNGFRADIQIWCHDVGLAESMAESLQEEGGDKHKCGTNYI